MKTCLHNSLCKIERIWHNSYLLNKTSFWSDKDGKNINVIDEKYRSDFLALLLETNSLNNMFQVEGLYKSGFKIELYRNHKLLQDYNWKEINEN